MLQILLIFAGLVLLTTIGRVAVWIFEEWTRDPYL
jgi:hypothetical protein